MKSESFQSRIPNCQKPIPDDQKPRKPPRLETPFCFPDLTYCLALMFPATHPPSEFFKLSTSKNPKTKTEPTLSTMKKKTSKIFVCLTFCFTFSVFGQTPSSEEARSMDLEEFSKRLREGLKRADDPATEWN